MNTYTCPDWPTTDDFTGKDAVVGCGEQFEAEPDDEGFVDCPHCGIFFDPSRPMNRNGWTLPDEVTVIAAYGPDGHRTATIVVPRVPLDRVLHHEGTTRAVQARTTDGDWLGVALTETDHQQQQEGGR